VIRTKHQSTAILVFVLVICAVASGLPKPRPVAIALATTGASFKPMQAGSLVVTNTNDSGPGSLRQAVLDANAAAGANVITFDASVFNTPRTIALTSGVIALASDLTITGSGTSLLTVSGNNASRIFSVPETQTVTISDLTLTQGNSATGAAPGFGGAIYNQGALTLTNLVMTGNSATSDGGAVYVSTSGDSLAVNNCTISNNTASRNGGGIYADDGSILTVTSSVIQNNTAQTPSASAGGGGIYLDTATFTMINSTVRNNISNLHGGGLAFDTGGTSTITLSTISGNAAAGQGGGMYLESTPLALTNSTVSGNSATTGGGISRGIGTAGTDLSYSTIAHNTASADGGGIFAQEGVAAGNTIIGNNSAGGFGPDYRGPVTSQGYNLIENVSGASIAGTTTGNITGLDPILGPLQNNGGPTSTHTLLSGSPAIDTADPENAPSTDQRGLPRPTDGNSDGTARADIGAVEMAAGSTPVPSPTPTPSPSPSPQSTPTPEPTPAPAPAITINGRVTDSTSGAGIVDVTMRLSSSQNQLMTQTDANGDYSFPNLPAGDDYGIVPSKTGFGFNPIVQNFFNLNSNAVANFTGSSGAIPGPSPSPSPTPCTSSSNGCLDPTFDSNGTATGPQGFVTDLAMQTDGKFVVVGGTSSINYVERHSRLARYKPDGSLDTTFGTGGVVTTDVAAGQGDSFAAVAIQPDGKVVVAGSAFAPPGTTPVLNFVLARYNANGTLDPTFGVGGTDGDGIVTTGFFDFESSARDVILQIDGKIIAVGLTRSSDGGQDFAVARYQPDGSLDTSFGTGGKVTTGFFGRPDAASAALLQPDGKIVVAGSAQSSLSSSSNEFALARFNQNGSLDTSFDSDGKVTTDFGSIDLAADLARLTDGRIVLVGTSNQNFALARYNSDGSLDPTFGTDGKVVTDFGAAESASSLVVQSDGKIVAAGNTVTCATRMDFALARYNTDGSLDTGFGAGGRRTTDFFGRNDGASAVVLQPDGRIVAAGNANSTGALFDTSFALARYATGNCAVPTVTHFRDIQIWYGSAFAADGATVVTSDLELTDRITADQANQIASTYPDARVTSQIGMWTVDGNDIDDIEWLLGTSENRPAEQNLRTALSAVLGSPAFDAPIDRGLQQYLIETWTTFDGQGNPVDHEGYSRVRYFELNARGPCTAHTLITEEGTNRVAAVNSVTYIRHPFMLSDDFNFSSDRRTRISFLTSNLGLTQPDPSILTVQGAGLSFLVEYVGPIAGGGLNASQIIVRLPDGLPPGDWPLTVTLRGVNSCNNPILSIVASPGP
jgi:uncharacterized delta-60 repeat protein